MQSESELRTELCLLCQQNLALSHTMTMQSAELEASNAHCTIVQSEITDLCTQLANWHEKKTRPSTKLKAHFVTLPELKDIFNLQEAERLEKEKRDAEKLAQKA